MAHAEGYLEKQHGAAMGWSQFAQELKPSGN